MTQDFDRFGVCFLGNSVELQRHDRSPSQRSAVGTPDSRRRTRECWSWILVSFPPGALQISEECTVLVRPLSGRHHPLDEVVPYGDQRQMCVLKALASGP